MFGRQKHTESIQNEFEKALEDLNIKDGFVKVSRIKKNANGRQIGGKAFFVKTIPLRNLRKKPIEEFLAEHFGGGEFEVELYKRNDNASESFVETFYFPIDGPVMYDDETPENTKESAYEKLMLKMLEKQLDTGGDSETKELLRAVLSQNSGNNLLQQIQTLKEIQSVIAPPAVPNINPESDTTALLNLAGKIVPALLTRGQGNVNPADMQKSHTIAELQLPNNQTNTPKTDEIHLGNNGNKPANISIQRAFEVIYLERFKAEIALIKDDPTNAVNAEDIAGMIESMTVSSIYWLQPSEYHPVLREFIEGFQKVDLGKLKSGFNQIMEYAEVIPELAEKIQTIMISTYQNRIMANQGKGEADENSAETE